MTKYGVSEAKSRVGFKSYAVPSRALGQAKSLRGWLFRGAVFVSAFSIVFSVFVPTNFVQGSPENKNGNNNNNNHNQEQNITICHATNSHTNPYNLIEVAKPSVLNAHGDHTGPVWFSGITVK
jgi:hypothetical protein